MMTFVRVWIRVLPISVGVLMLKLNLCALMEAPISAKPMTPPILDLPSRAFGLLDAFHEKTFLYHLQLSLLSI